MECDFSETEGLDNTTALSCTHCLLSSIIQRGSFYTDEKTGKNFLKSPSTEDVL